MLRGTAQTLELLGSIRQTAQHLRQSADADIRQRRSEAEADRLHAREKMREKFDALRQRLDRYL